MCAPSRPCESSPGEGTDLPGELVGCQIKDVPGLVPRKGGGTAFWSGTDVASWLSSAANDPLKAPVGTDVTKELRIHVELEHGRGAAKEGMLFQTEGVCLGSVRDGEGYRVVSIAASYEPEGLIAFTARVLSLGGERRLASCRDTEARVFACPEQVKTSLASANRVRLQLATPALFRQGWKPAWSEQAGVGLRLVGACVSRRVPLAGWNVFGGSGHLGEPKPLRWMAPAGSVYFFEVKSGDPGRLASRWLESVSDDEQDRRDGHGLALWGVWK